jgi:hypothetical protein
MSPGKVIFTQVPSPAGDHCIAPDKSKESCNIGSILWSAVTNKVSDAMTQETISSLSHCRCSCPTLLSIKKSMMRMKTRK